MARRVVEAKTPEQLRREIAYYARQLQTTTSRDRLERAHKAIAKRERLLKDCRHG